MKRTNEMLGFVEECLLNNDKRSILIFLLDTLNTSVIRLNNLKECIEIYPNVPDVDEVEE